MTHLRFGSLSLLRAMPIVVVLAAASHARAQCTNSWLPIAPGANNEVLAMTPWDPDGPGPQPTVLVVGGRFSTIGGIAAHGIAIYDPALGTWSAMGTPQYTVVRSLTAMTNGDLVATLFQPGSQGAVDTVARWHGSGWAPLGTAAGNTVRCLLSLPNGDLIVGGDNLIMGGTVAMGVARWNGSSWSAMPGLVPLSTYGIAVRALTTMSNGDIVAGGMFTCSGGAHLARWNGTGWTGMGIVMGSGLLELVQAAVGLPNNRLLVAHTYSLNYWNGSTWSPLGVGSGLTSLSHALSLASNGDALVGDNNIGVARWDGSTWSTFGSGMVGAAYAFANLPNGDLMVGGYFSSAGGLPASHIARVTTSCPATVATYGAGCAGAGGLDVLSPVTLPWIGSTFRARAVGMPPLALVLSVYGLTTQSIPFASVFPQALPGCTILMNGDLIDVLLPNAGVVDTQIALPDALTLVGAAFHHYVVPFEVDATLTVTAITNSNALTCTLGAF